MGNGMDKILPGLYVGNIRGASSKPLLDKNGITHILAIFDKAQPVNNGRTYLCIQASDIASQELTQYFSQCNDFIHNARVNKGTVLVHCVAGMSRSVTVTTAYIMTVTNLGWREALNAVRGARRSANPNFGFQRQLLAFYHDHLPAEKQRLFANFPPSPYEDQSECERLIEEHRHWVLHGDEEADDSETTYPLQHNAYSNKDGVTSSDVTSGSAHSNSDNAQDQRQNADMKSSTGDIQKMQGNKCSSCLRIIPEVNEHNKSEDLDQRGELLCAACSDAENAVINLVNSAPEVPCDEKENNVSEIAHVIQGASGSTSQNEDQTDSGSNQALVDSLFTANPRSKEQNVSFNENIQISKVDKIDTQMAENAAIKPSNPQNCHDIGTQNISKEDADQSKLVDDLFTTSSQQNKL